MMNSIVFGSDFDKYFTEISSAFNELYSSSRQSYSEKFPPMNTEVNVENGDLVLSFALAGYSREDLAVTVDADTIHLNGKKPQGKKDEQFRRIDRAIRSSDFHCKYTLPSGKYSTAEMRATYKDGILQLTLPAVRTATKSTIVIQ